MDVTKNIYFSGFVNDGEIYASDNGGMSKIGNTNRIVAQLTEKNEELTATCLEYYEKLKEFGVEFNDDSEQSDNQAIKSLEAKLSTLTEAVSSIQQSISNLTVKNDESN